MRICFLFNYEPSKELSDARAGKVPTHRVSGAVDLPLIGVDVTTFRWGSLPAVLRSSDSWKLWQGIKCLLAQTRFDAVVATAEACSLPVLALRKLRLMR
jgi:hypothetical protein